ncbi:MAG: NCS2 family permease, partial [Tannerellaceae bacterium]
MQTFLENWFQLKKNGTNVKTELIAGLTTFMTMAYILIVNPSMLSECGMDKPSVFTATVVSSIIATLL